MRTQEEDKYPAFLYPVGYQTRLAGYRRGWVSYRIPERDWPDLGYDKRLDIQLQLDTREGLAG